MKKEYKTPLMIVAKVKMQLFLQEMSGGSDHSDPTPAGPGDFSRRFGFDDDEE